MATGLKTTGKLGAKKTDLKRVEVYLTNEVYEILSKEATAQSRSTKNYIEVFLTTKAHLLKTKK